MNPLLSSSSAIVLRALASVSLFIGLAASLFAQKPPELSAQDRPFRIQVKVDAVLVPVVVRDSHGHFVGTLKKEDFQLFDKNKLRPLSGFTLEKNLPLNPEAAPTPIVPGTPSSPAPPQTAVPPQRFVIFLFDDLHLTPGDLAQVQKAAIKMLPISLADSDLAAVVSFAGTYSGVTHDHAKLQESILKLQSHNLYRNASRDCPDMDYYRADLIQNKHDNTALEAAIQDTLACRQLDPKTMRNLAESIARASASQVLNVGDQDVRVTLAFLKELLGKMTALPGQRTLILVSPGFLTLTPEALSAKSRIIDMAAQANITISTLGAKGLYTTEIDASERGPASAFAMASGYESQSRRESLSLTDDVMAELADGTGGTFFHNSNDLSGGLKTLTAAPEYLYLLEFSLDDVKPDGTYHHLKVKVDQKGLKLQARRGYFAPVPPK